ncbi:hypothetical protein HPS174_0516 [Glaesserella parasuis 174]|nr:hypothetical protein HPSSW114_1759 [Glaesserella parasuis SW114]EQA07723.1 hypothetical protein HPSH465_1289 [Glaesserella parasuis H465]EQA14459.1 hypothetical protein HPS174_0516 [Glaesserella parasuis 174]
MQEIDRLIFGVNVICPYDGYHLYYPNRQQNSLKNDLI